MSQQQAIVSSAQPDGMMETLAPLVLLWALPLYIAGGFLGLLQFKLVCTCPVLMSLECAHNGALHLVPDVGCICRICFQYFTDAGVWLGGQCGKLAEQAVGVAEAAARCGPGCRRPEPG